MSAYNKISCKCFYNQRWTFFASLAFIFIYIIFIHLQTLYNLNLYIFYRTHELFMQAEKQLSYIDNHN